MPARDEPRPRLIDYEFEWEKGGQCGLAHVRKRPDREYFEGYQDMGSHLERRHILYVIRHIENGETGGQTKHARPLKWTLIKRTESPS